MTVVYLDSVFALNAVMDYLLLVITASLAGIAQRRRRCALIALLGGLYAAATFLPGCAVLSAAPIKVATGVVMVLLAFGREAHLLRLTLLFFLLSGAMAGCILGASFLAAGLLAPNGTFFPRAELRGILLTAAAVYVVLTVVFRTAAGHGVRGERVPVRISVGGRTADLTALWDNGNTLRDPVGDRAVLVVSPEVMNPLLPPSVRRHLTPSGLRSPAELLEPIRLEAPQLHPRLIPYHAVGTDSGLLLLVQTDWTEIGGRRYDGLPAALSPSQLGTGYTALWGGAIKEGKGA